MNSNIKTKISNGGKDKLVYAGSVRWLAYRTDTLTLPNTPYGTIYLSHTANIKTLRITGIPKNVFVMCNYMNDYTGFDKTHFSVDNVKNMSNIFDIGGNHFFTFLSNGDEIQMNHNTSGEIDSLIAFMFFGK